MGVVSKLTELAKVQLTLSAAPATARTATTANGKTAAPAGLTAEQLIAELQRQKRSAA